MNPDHAVKLSEKPFDYYRLRLFLPFSVKHHVDFLWFEAR